MKMLITFLLFTTCAVAQEHNIWYFGRNAGLDFNGGAPIALTNGQTSTVEGTASIADNNGDLLFYTDGVTIWNKNHQVMENGNGLMGHESSTQSAIIIPKPGAQQHYYVFTVPAEGTYGFRYSTVDMEINGGLGAVISKNILLQAPAAEGINATLHNNGEDIWVVAHGYNLNLFYAYLVTAGGVSSSPVISSSVIMPDVVGMGSVKISPNGSKLVFTRANQLHGTQVFDFNNTNGIISNPVQLVATGGYDYGAEFSASGEVLYTTSGPDLYQYDLLANDIGASGIVINSGSNIGFGSLQRGPDNKIYAARNNQNYLSVINTPDTVGTGCNFVPVAINLGGNGITRLSTFGLPNTVLPPVFKINLDNQAICIGQEATFSIIPATIQFESILWEFGDGNTSGQVSPIHTYQVAGTYTVKLTAHRQGITKVTQTTIVVLPIPQISQPADITLCDVNNNGIALFNLQSQNAATIGNQDPADFNITYHASIEYAETGTYSLPADFNNTGNPQTIYVRMEDKNSGCYATASFKLIVAPRPVITKPDSYAICKGGNVLLTAPEGFTTYVWSTGETTRAITVNEPGNYTITLDNNGWICGNSKVVTVYVSDAPIITQIGLGDWTDDNNTISISVSGPGNYEFSLDGITYQESPEFTGLQSGIYNVYARDVNGCGYDMQEIVLLMYPKFFTPNEDGINDTWHIKYSWNEPGLLVFIFDRYGKYITSFKGNSPGWDGKLNGHALPATDYWFIVERSNGRQYKGHFAMVR